MSKRQRACPEQATARRMSRMLMPLQKREVHLLKSPRSMMFDLMLDVMNGFLAKIGSIGSVLLTTWSARGRRPWVR